MLILYCNNTNLLFWEDFQFTDLNDVVTMKTMVSPPTFKVSH